MPTPTITWVMLALILGILIGAALNERWHTRNDHQEHDGVEGGSYLWAESTIGWPDTETVPAVAHEWGEIDAAATRAAFGATSAALARGRSMDLDEAGAAISRTLQYDIDAGVRYAALRRDPKVTAILDTITSGLRAETERRFREAAGMPLLTLTCDRLDAQAAPYLLDDRSFEGIVGAPRAAILKGLGFADRAG